MNRHGATPPRIPPRTTGTGGPAPKQHCRYCGTIQDPGAKRCPSCGAPR